MSDFLSFLSSIPVPDAHRKPSPLNGSVSRKMPTCMPPCKNSTHDELGLPVAEGRPCCYQLLLDDVLGDPHPLARLGADQHYA